ncbi:hypothetical protein MWU75_12095 [Ornithinimicrobium sp. F0845]|uniref:VOC family protein n=1 Tax=Ornithinimicrobium sp. F0845 TaxID=2926412 RepID=UPI001FF601CF|nr:hypothetical protein [Ornithinimicrobium sp. F0845]MCK0112881.1 hypothetical protein [Ornithinimicrobium sp. F0845]
MTHQLAARPIRFTADTAAHRRWLETLGATVVTDAPGWTVLAIGSGRLALHAASEDRPAGLTTLGWEVADLDAWHARTRATVPGTLGEAPHGRAVTVTAPDGTTFTVDPVAAPEQPAPADPALSVLPIWVTQDVDGARDILRGMGAQGRLVADSNVWTDYTLPGGGMVAVHDTDGEPEVELAFEFDGDVETLIPALREVGVEALLIDETYGRTLQVPDLDNPGRTIWINEAQRDLYGYRRMG